MLLSPEWNVAISILSLVLMIFGLIGMIVPLIPGVFLIWTTIFSYALLTQFTVIDLPLVGWLSAILFIVIVLDFWESRRGTRPIHINASMVFGALLIGGLAFWIFQDPWIFILGALLGAIFGALAQGQELLYRIETPNHIIIGFFGATLVKMIMGLAVIVIFVQRVLEK